MFGMIKFFFRLVVLGLAVVGVLSLRGQWPLKSSPHHGNSLWPQGNTVWDDLHVPKPFFLARLQAHCKPGEFTPCLQYCENPVPSITTPQPVLDAALEILQERLHDSR